MAFLSLSIVLLAVAGVVFSSPLTSVASENVRLNRYSPVRMIMDTLCTTFETSFCKGEISPATANHILPETSVKTREIPSICRPSKFKDYRNFVDKRPFHSISKPIGTKQDCCLTCYDVGDCLSWVFDPNILQCNYYVATTRAQHGGETDVCPLGVDEASYEEMPGYPVMLGSGFGHNYGPCLADAPLNGRRADARSETFQTATERQVSFSQRSDMQQNWAEL